MAEVLMPEYVKDFHCIGGACEDTCCKIWNITVDKNTYRKYMACKDPDLKQKLIKKLKRFKTGHDYAVIELLPETKMCPFVNKDGLCEIQLIMGEQALSQTCSFYPRRSRLIDGKHREMTLLPSCPEAARRCLLNKEPMQFITADISFDDKDAVKFTPNNIRETVQSFYARRDFMIETLQNRRFPFEDRLLLLGMFMQKLPGLRPSDIPVVVDGYRTLFASQGIEDQIADLPVNPRMQVLLISEIVNHLTPDIIIGRKRVSRYTKMLVASLGGLGIIEGLSPAEQAERYLDASTKFHSVKQQYDYIFENYFVNSLFTEDARIFGLEFTDSKILAPHPNASWNLYLSICLEYLILKFHFTGMYVKANGLPDEESASIASMVAHDVFAHNRQRVKDMIDILYKKDYNGLAHMATAIRL
ncbi:MAG: flagellin lysine-N-methylase [Christensenellaceae bacterium]|jgi:lysine-N-methylase